MLSSLFPPLPLGDFVNMGCFWIKKMNQCFKMACKKIMNQNFHKGLKISYAIKFFICRLVPTPVTWLGWEGLHSFLCHFFLGSKLRPSPLVPQKIVSQRLPKCLVFGLILVSALKVSQLSKGKREKRLFLFSIMPTWYFSASPIFLS